MAFDEGTKERREKKVETLIRMRNEMMESDDWESHKEEIEAVTLGGMAIQRLNRIDFDGEDVIILGKEYSYNEYEIEHRGKHPDYRFVVTKRGSEE